MPRSRGGQKMFSGEKKDHQLSIVSHNLNSIDRNTHIEFKESTGGPLRKKMMLKDFDESPDV